MVSIRNCEKYQWGANCLGWHLVDNPALSVIQEIIPAGSSEARHRHIHSQQFFYILKGSALFYLNEKTETLKQFEGIHVQPNDIHKIENNTSEDVEFLVISQPHAHGDRENIE